MKATVLYGPRDVRCVDVPEPKIEQPTDAIIRLAASCICGSDPMAFSSMGNSCSSPRSACWVGLRRSAGSCRN
jgi:threonine dehydrogenase-like Zn-dependent dehydrogenase